MVLKTIKLRFKNLAQSGRTADIIIFQKDNFSSIKIFAWHVIHNCRFICTNYFNYSKEVDLIICDNDNNEQILSNVQKGRFYTFSNKEGILERDESTTPETIEVQNKLKEGTITASLHRNNKAIFAKTEICPDEIISLSFNNEIYVGRTETINPGQVLSKKLLNRFKTKINLDNIKSADLVLRGGGFGAKAKRFYFEIENIVND